MKILQEGLPLFPLQTVLFPQSRLPLHIFEPRYREMIERCLEEDLAFGVALIKEGVEVGGPAVVREIGTIARIGDLARLSDGSMNLVAIGVMRFKILETFSDRPYMTARVERWPDEDVDLAKSEPAARAAAKAFEDYIRMIQQVAGGQEEPEGKEERSFNAPKDPTVLSYLLASNLEVSQTDKQSLLEAPTVVARLRREILFMRRELELLRRVREGVGQAKDQGTFSMN